MSRYARSERKALADLMSTLGPQAPTVNEGWTVRDLAAHLVIRERRPDAAAGILLPPLRDRGERVRRQVAAGDWADLLDQVRNPPVWSPMSNPLTDELANTLEFFIHHEDVRRAQPQWQPRELPAGLDQTLWRRTSTMARLRLRRFPARLVVQAPGHGEVVTGQGGETVRLVGPPGELTLFLSGRQRVARVEIEGPTALADRLRGAKLGF
ncbi:TIGR03085 family metal-binding protein [Micromonospora sp. NPDC048871]|uniref:TIGR03085 family metal-binding protein n=1 Tax=unclassified Micromonospora TaxID=2617518 RepID=UPI002E15259F|nr:TIGR03085 family metal-binding protein [Micromonospora sp. NBC_01739]